MKNCVKIFFSLCLGVSLIFVAKADAKKKFKLPPGQITKHIAPGKVGGLHIPPGQITRQLAHAKAKNKCKGKADSLAESLGKSLAGGNLTDILLPFVVNGITQSLLPVDQWIGKCVDQELALDAAKKVLK